MGYKQTPTHRFGKHSYHQIGLVRGQFGNVPMETWVKFIQDAGFDGWEEASWELDLTRCGSDRDAEAYAKERVDLAKRHGLEIFTVATHLQGQVLGLPLYKLLGGRDAPPPGGDRGTRLKFVIGAVEPAKAAERARGMVQRGWRAMS